MVFADLWHANTRHPESSSTVILMSCLSLLSTLCSHLEGGGIVYHCCSLSVAAQQRFLSSLWSVTLVVGRQMNLPSSSCICYPPSFFFFLHCAVSVSAQLEDDIVAKPNYFATMKNFALQLSSEDWMILEFSQLGFIGMIHWTIDQYSASTRLCAITQDLHSQLMAQPNNCLTG